MMRSARRSVGLLILLALFLNAFIVSAQEPVTVGGSGIVAPVFTALDQADNDTADFTVSVNGTNNGLAEFCAGTADLALANRPLTIEEEAACAANGVAFVETLLGYHILAVVTNSSNTFAECLTLGELNSLFAPSATGQITDWSQINPGFTPGPVLTYIPLDDNPDYALADRLLEGDGLRSDANKVDTETALAAAAENTAAVALVNASAVAADSETVKLVEVDIGDGTGCNAPAVGNVESRQYSAAERLFVYVNAAQLSNPNLQSLLAYVSTPEGTTVVTEQGYTPLSLTMQTTLSDIVANAQTGRSFSREVTAFNVAPDIFGNVTIGGAPEGVAYLQGVTGAITSVYTGLTSEFSFTDEADGISRLCAGTLDIAIASRALTDEERAACDTAGVTIVPVNLGAQAVVLVGNAGTEFLGCLTTEQLATVWQVSSSETVTTWNQVDPAFAETPITLFAPNLGSVLSDILLIKVTGTANPGRSDLQLNDDQLYNAAAIGNVEGALGYMDWPSYQAVLENNQANIQLVAVDAGSGCVAPGIETIVDGSYPLIRPLTLLVNQSSLVRPEVEGLLWLLVSDSSYSYLEQAGYVGVMFADLPDLRETLQTAFAEAAVAAANAEATPDPNATAEATAAAESTETAATEPAPEPTTEATAEATAEPTAEATSAS